MRPGRITRVQIGRWRELTASPTRQIAEVRLLLEDRGAIRIQQKDTLPQATNGTIWQLYDFNGQLLAMLQNRGEKQEWVTTKFQPGQPVQENTDSEMSVSA